MKESHALLLFILFLTVGGLMAQPASAQKIDGAFHLSMNTSLLRYTSTDMKLEELDQEKDAEAINLGPAIPGIIFGYGLSDNFLLGLGLSPSRSSYEVEDGGEMKSFTLIVGPFIRYIFSIQGGFKPFLQLELGIAMQKMLISGFIGASDFENSQTDIAIVATVGGQGFATDTFSIDPFVSFVYLQGSGEIEAGPFGDDFLDSGYSLTLGVALSGWIAL